MEEKILKIINQIRESKGMSPLTKLTASDDLRDNVGFTSFDLAELTVRLEDEYGVDVFEDGLVSTIGEILEKLNK
ncbi:acyl carrier protein [Mediterranea sp. An20]|uniref:phosphopantetheine-binding protein n=1 Tax=Mediterranea sp. An20 TaxID=1965586 RepID=UPI000B39D23C|nr:phosphopantetheine-binding protein [Mediterranea sp. An20]OUP07880.1 acyl carrier protein [Mediterranea sp. An20]